jgi:hypothetical protein
MAALRIARLALRSSTWKRVIVIAALLISSSGSVASAQECLPEAAPKIIVMRGLLEIFSLGMNDLAEKLRCRGYDATSTSWTLALFSLDYSGDRPVIVIGHSLGGRMCGWASRILKSHGQRVPLIFVVDANLLTSIPSNVDKCVNLYVTNELGIFHGSPVWAESPETQIVNWDVSRGQPSMFVGGVNHFDIDATDWVHDIIIREIECRFPLGTTMPEDYFESYSLRDGSGPTVSPMRISAGKDISNMKTEDQGVGFGARVKDPFENEIAGKSDAISNDEAQLLRRAEASLTHVLGPDEEDPFEAEERRNKPVQWQPSRSNQTEVVGVTVATGRIARVPWQPTRPRAVNSQLNP